MKSEDRKPSSSFTIWKLDLGAERISVVLGKIRSRLFLPVSEELFVRSRKSLCL